MKISQLTNIRGGDGTALKKPELLQDSLSLIINHLNL